MSGIYSILYSIMCDDELEHSDHRAETIEQTDRRSQAIELTDHTADRP